LRELKPAAYRAIRKRLGSSLRAEISIRGGGSVPVIMVNAE
jgi:hypothetical protein